MKPIKQIALFILILSFFYTALGIYRLVGEHQEQVWISAIENTPNSKYEVFEFKINPYAYIVDSGFEEANQDIVINKTLYHVFKNRIQNNVLKLYCVKSKHKSILNKNIKKLVEEGLFDSDSNTEKSTKKNIKSFVKDYILHKSNYEIVLKKIRFGQVPFQFFTDGKLNRGYFAINYPPPIA